MGIALLAAIAMVASDVLATIMVQAEAANLGWLAGFCDTAGWYVAIATTTISVTSLSGHDTARKIWVLGLVGAANLFGTKLGQVTGKRVLHRFPAAINPELVELHHEQIDLWSELEAQNARLELLEAARP
jgi:hypothetical protein